MADMSKIVFNDRVDAALALLFVALVVVIGFFITSRHINSTKTIDIKLFLLRAIALLCATLAQQDIPTAQRLRSSSA